MTPFLLGTPDARRVFLQPADTEDRALLEGEAAALEELAGRGDWCLAVLPVEDWFRDLAPWRAEPAFGKQAFGDGAADTLARLLDEVIPSLERERPGERSYVLGGYSLAGLFSLWAAYQTDRFAGVAAVSPSVWYPGWIEYAAERPIRTPRVYLSLGLREEKTKNRAMAAVGDNLRTQHRLLSQAGVRCRLDWNPGHHFMDSDRRVARGLAWLLEELRSSPDGT